MNPENSRSENPEGSCICLECNTRIPSQDWILCFERSCPRCGAIMVREKSPYYWYALAKEYINGKNSDRSPRRAKKSGPRRWIPAALGHRG
jgi:hypothetical protein